MRTRRALLPLFAASFAAAPAVAQPGASWTESGDVSIRMAAPGPLFYGREAEEVLESDVVDEITVGESGLVEDQQTDTLRISIGDPVTPRHLGDLFVLVGTLEVGTNLWLVGAQVTVRSGVGVDSRIEVAGDFGRGNSCEDTFGTGTLTIEDGGYLDVDGTFTIRPLATLIPNGGTLRVTAFDYQGAFNENGGTLIVSETATPAVAAWLALALVARRARRRR